MEYRELGRTGYRVSAISLKPAEQFFATASAREVGIIACVPLASGLLSGKLRRDTQFDPKDHRSFNRYGEAFDRGETFAGLDYEIGLQAVEELRSLLPKGASMAQFALRWILMFPEISCAIPGARTPRQTEENVVAAQLPPLDEQAMREIAAIYDRFVRAQVDHLW